MKAKNKLSLDSENKTIQTQLKSFNTPYRFMKLRAWGTSFEKDQEMKDYVHSNENNLNQYLERLPININIEESFILVDELNILHILVY